MFSDNSIKKILNRAGAKRINKAAIKKFKKIIEDYSFGIARKAVKNAQYSGRKTLMIEDIKEAIKTEET
ncbi:MAG: NFYB/HAP3 family transcription factor subunit [Candidatus Pacearchaeota archaeon]